MDLLSNILDLLRLKGTFYFRTSFNRPWGVAVPAFENVSRFHFVHRGRCWVTVAGVDSPVLLEQGDLVIITHGAAHSLRDQPDTPLKTVDQVVAEAGFTGEGALVIGDQGTGHETQLICGHFAFDSDATHPLIEKLPPYLHIKNFGEASTLWLEATLKLIGAEAGRSNLGGDLIALKLTEIIFTQAIRAFLASDGQRQLVFKGIADTHIGRSLTEIHRNPAHSWTLESMARVAGLSRTAFANRFQDLMGMTPIQYLTNWRMQIARRSLVESENSIYEVAEQSGYQSEAAFGRVFKRHFDLAPATYRRVRRAEDRVA
ncbi:AraC family transcriptional regulator [Pelagibius sp. Alg239-R121]|uniref:AraC family transcriptional regulator n=1 Tax=Pelagibius sp. Alg239-R121 TaxID=2993448 RepID=UPI0024A6CAAF|nr:AraC family transcriptional regulator [Pelagibius sp. Alg239-R121]